MSESEETAFSCRTVCAMVRQIELSKEEFKATGSCSSFSSSHGVRNLASSVKSMDGIISPSNSVSTSPLEEHPVQSHTGLVGVDENKNIDTSPLHRPVRDVYCCSASNSELQNADKLQEMSAHRQKPPISAYSPCASKSGGNPNTSGKWSGVNKTEASSLLKCSPFGYMTSIPKARLAFVTEMVENSNEESGAQTKVDDPKHATLDDIAGEYDDHENVQQRAEISGRNQKKKFDKPFEEFETSAVRSFSQKVPQWPITSENDAIDKSSILENKDQLRQLWERRIMADDQQISSHDSLISVPVKGEESEIKEKKVIVENGTSSVCSHTESPEKGDPDTHDNDTADCVSSTDRDNNNSVTKSAESQALANGNEPSIETSEGDHVDALKDEDSEGANDHDNVTKEDKMPEKDDDSTACDPLTAERKENSCLSDDQKADKTDDPEKHEIVSSPQEAEEVIDSGKPERDIEEPIDCGQPECSIEVTQVADDLEQQFDEPNTEAYYTSSFTFVCQKSHEEDEEEKYQESHDEAGNLADEDIPEKENSQAEDICTCDDEVASISEAKEPPVSDASHSEHFESIEGKEISSDNMQLSYEQHVMMNSDFQETSVDAGNTQSSEPVNDKSEIESEIDVDYKLNNITDEDKDLPSRAESATPDSAKSDKIERPTHFVRLKPTGVQKTERPYDSGTTESKIAMEIREMREREEELRLMRERMQSPEGKASPPALSPQPSPTEKQSHSGSPEPGPGYRVSTVFGHKGIPVQSPVEEEKKTYRSFSKESAVEKEIRIAKNREEELRKEKGLPPREDDSYIKPSQVKSAQVRVFGKMNASNATKELATTKIQQEIEEQTLREMALREKGHIQTISQERTDSKVAKLKDLDVSLPECTSPTSPNGHGFFSDRSSKRSSPSPTGSSHGSMPPVSRPVTQGKGISMQKFIASKGKETTFIASRNGPSHPEQSADASRSNPVMRKAKRTVSVESKIQQEILEMKLREEELRRMHYQSGEQSFLTTGENGTEEHGAAPNDVSDYVNGQEMNGNDESGPNHNNLIAQWEQRIQKAEGKA